MKSGDYVKLKMPERTSTVGQGEHPKGMTVSANGEIYFLSYGAVFKISKTADPKNKIGSLAQKPYPLLHLEFVEEFIDQFETIKIKEK